MLTSNGELTRAGVLFFGRNPQQYECSFVIKAVAFAGNDIGDTNYLDSRDIAGTLPWMFREGMAFLKSYSGAKGNCLVRNDFIPALSKVLQP